MQEVNIETFRSAGVLPSGPVSAWPKDRHDKLLNQSTAGIKQGQAEHDKKIKASTGKMLSGITSGIRQVITSGKVSEEIREERYAVCQACPHFIEESKRCSECGCFMELKTWIAGNPDNLCPKKKWKK